MFYDLKVAIYLTTMFSKLPTRALPSQWAANYFKILFRYL